MSEQAVRIVNFGSMNLDYVYRVPHFTSPGESLTALSQSVIPGGKGLNQSVALARAGADVFHAGCLGTGGEMLAEVLRENDIDISLLQKTDKTQGCAIIQVNDEGENCIIVYGGSNRTVTTELVDETLSHFSSGDMLVLQNEINCLGYIVEQAARKGMQIILNPSPYDAQLQEIDYASVSWLLVNEVEALQITGCSQPEAAWEQIHAKYPGLNVVITLGKAGSVCFTQDQTIWQEAYPAAAVDTTAAGDTFTGFFLAALAAGEPLEVCMRRASKASSIAVSRNGASSSIPTAEEVDRSISCDTDR